MFVCFHACFHVCLFVFLFSCLFVRLFVFRFVCLFVCLFSCLFVCLFVSLFICLFVYLFVCFFLSAKLVVECLSWLLVLNSGGRGAHLGLSCHRCLIISIKIRHCSTCHTNIKLILKTSEVKIN